MWSVFYKMKRQNKIAAAISRNTAQKNMSFHVSIRNILLTAQILGYMPVKGIYYPQISGVTFSWLSRRMLYSLLTLAGAIFLTTIQLKKSFYVKIKMPDIHKLCLYLMEVCSSILFIKLAREWPQFIKTWSRMENSMALYGWPPKLNKKINSIIVVFIVLLLIEYGLMQAVEFSWVNYCEGYLNKNDFCEVYLTKNFFSHSFFSYNIISTIFILYANFQAFFSCTIVDVLIMVLSISLAARLKQIKKRIKTVISLQSTEENIWREIREDYDRLEHLCKSVNSTFSWFIVLSFVGNLSLILIQLFITLQLNSSLEKICLYYSFGYLIARTACVCIYGAAVNDECRKALVHLYNLPDSIYNREIERMIHQISSNNMALTGLNFFVVKRDLTLKIAGALVAYELIIIQIFGDLLQLDYINGSLCISPHK